MMDSSVEKMKDSCLMKTHFLKPCVTSIDDGPVAELPRRRQRFSVSSSLSNSASGFRFLDRNFLSWTRKMEALHEATWRKAGIFEAIKASTYKIHKNKSLLLALVERWCPETKSFVFPWGEATITLEDVMVLLGFSVLGSPVFAPLESSEMRDSVEKLKKVRAEIMSRDCGVSLKKWVLSFRDRDDSLEHEAFLAMWLSHLVFPNRARCSISRHVFPIAVRLARGERIALAPAVLASLYRDLGRICATAGGKSCHQRFRHKSLLKLVQLWAWERFKNIRPRPREIQKGEPRIAQWVFQKHRYDKNERSSFDDFNWRPYAKSLKNWNPPRFYLEEAKWVTVDDSLDDEFVSFARCVRSSQLVGIGFVEDYYPNRVAMQFGLSQDLPGLVTHHSNSTEKESWDDYNKSLDGLKVYVPCRLATTSVTARYRDWWLKSVSEFLSSEEPTVGDDASPEVLPLSQVLQKLGGGFPAKFKRSRKLRIPRHMGSEIKKYKTGDCGASVSLELPLSELFNKELAKRECEHLRNKRRKLAREDDDESRMDSYVDITIAQLIKSGKKTGGDESESLGKSMRREEKNNDLRILQKLASGDDETVAPQKIELRSEETDEKERSEAEEAAVLSPSDENNFSDPPLGGKVGVVDVVVSPPEARQNCGCDGEVDVNGINAEKKAMDLRRREEDNNDLRIFQKLASGDDETGAPQEIEKRKQENDEEETKSEVEEITVLLPLKAGEACIDEVDVNGGNNPEKKKSMVDDGTKEAECLLHEDEEKQRLNEKEADERLKQRKLATELATEELALNLEARLMKVEKTLATIRNWKTRRNHI